MSGPIFRVRWCSEASDKVLDLKPTRSPEDRAAVKATLAEALRDVATASIGDRTFAVQAWGADPHLLLLLWPGDRAEGVPAVHITVELSEHKLPAVLAKHPGLRDRAAQNGAAGLRHELVQASMDLVYAWLEPTALEPRPLAPAPFKLQ